MQRALLQFNKPENYPLVKKALLRAGRRDLIGKGRDCMTADRGRAGPAFFTLWISYGKLYF